MTFKEKAVQLLFEHGMFQDQAEEVVRRAIEDSDKTLVALPMQGRWDDDIAGHPPVVVNLLWLSLKSIALEYIDETCPKAWFRPLFADTQDTASA